MPHYDYVCSECGYQEEVLQKMSDAPLIDCPKCHRDTFKRSIGGGLGLHFKGSGFYITDYDTSQKSPPKSPPKGSCGCGKTSCDS